MVARSPGKRSTGPFALPRFAPRVAGEGREGEAILWRDARLRVIHVTDRDYPGFCRVIWNAHVREMTDLAHADRRHCMDVVFAVEEALRRTIVPDKVNLVSLGNQVPHLHWHVIPRFADDAHFPDPIWAARRRPGTAHALDRDSLVVELRARLGESV